MMGLSVAVVSKRLARYDPTHKGAEIIRCSGCKSSAGRTLQVFLRERSLN
jgi:hypothetical protein